MTAFAILKVQGVPGEDIAAHKSSAQLLMPAENNANCSCLLIFRQPPPHLPQVVPGALGPGAPTWVEGVRGYMKINEY